jgi:hypothetical protein
MRKYLLLVILFLSGCILVNNSPDRCYSLWDPSQKDNCLIIVATETMNISKCGEISKNSLAEQCYALLISKGVQENSSTCAKLSGAMMDECFSRLAMKNNDTSACMRINSSYYRDNCLSKIAIASDRPDICESVSLNLSRDNCKNQIYADLAIKNKDTSFCKLLIAESSQSQQDIIDNCIFSLAKELNETSYCAQISNPFSKELCLTGRIDPASCNKITEPQGRQACLYISAVYSKDPNACATLPSSSMRDNCYMQVAKDTKNAKICSYISVAILKDQCEQLSPS